MSRDPGAPGQGAELGARLRAGDASAAPAVLNLVESRSPASREQTAELLRSVSPAALGGEARGHVVGVTGPPGAGKSTLLSELVAGWRRRGRSVAVLAVDPSSRRSGGALLGDRARIAHDPRDSGVFIRSTAAGERVGGLAPATRAAAQALASAEGLDSSRKVAGSQYLAEQRTDDRSQGGVVAPADGVRVFDPAGAEHRAALG